MTGRILFFLLLPICAFAQLDSIGLREVLVPDRSLRMITETSSVMVIADSIIARDGQSLTNLLRNSPVYFKENGFGMVASPSFRGTTAQQTAVIWNGINVNSQLNGLTDFNASGAREFDVITLRGGASGTTHGSSAIGGTVHLENRVRFNGGTSALFHSNYGSFNSSGIHARVANSNDKSAFSASVSNHYSDNDYELPSGRKNRNGQFKNTAMSAVASWKAGRRSTLTYYGYTFFSDRHFSLLFPTDPKTRYKDAALRNMAEWRGDFKWFQPMVKVAHINEEYKFHEDATSGGFAFGRTNSLVTRLDSGIRLTRDIFLNAVIENAATSARGSDVGSRDRNVFAASVVLRHKLSKAVSYNLSIRQESASDYQSPMLYAGAGKFKIIGNHFLKAGFAKSFRAPTFNDLYWGQGGNPDLRPETSLQAEAGYEFDGKNFNIQATGFANRIRDMIRWLPLSGGQWFPQNEELVNAYGMEIIASGKVKLGHQLFSASGHYAWTVSENQAGHQLIYVPVHKAGVVFDWGLRNLSASVSCQFTGPVHTRSDNNSRYALDGYATTDARLSYTLNKLTFGILARNLLDAEYQVVERRYFPGRNYMIELTFKP